MKPTKPSITFLFTMLIAGGILLGCASTGIQRSTEASTTMQTMDSVIKLVVVQLGATGASLDELTKPGQSDVRKAFDLYTANVSKLENLEKDFARHAEQMEVRGREYFEEWQKDGDTYKSPEIQKLSEQRRLELTDIYGRIAQNSIGVKESFKAYVSESKEIQRYLSNDLTPRGIQAIEPIAVRAVLDGEILNDSIRDLQSAIERAQVEMYQAGSTLPRS
jgi:hypothetical protein